MLLDLREYWDNDPDIAADEYFTTVLDAVSVDGEAHRPAPVLRPERGVPERAVLEELGMDPEGISSVTCQQLLDWQEQAGDPDLQVTFGGWTQEEFCRGEAPACLDLENKTASFNSPAFVEFLVRTGSLKEADTGLDLTSRTMWQSRPDKRPAYLQATGEDFPVQNLPYADLYLESGAPWGGLPVGDLPGLHGLLQRAFGLPGRALSFCGQPVGVWRLPLRRTWPCPPASPTRTWPGSFVKYCVGERDSMQLSNQEMYTTNFPLSKGNFQNLLEVYKEGGGYRVRVRQPAGLWTRASWTAPRPWRSWRSFWPCLCSTGNCTAWTLGSTWRSSTQKGLTTPEECAEKIQGRAEIGLNE